MKKIGIYIRASTSKQDKGLNAQKRALEEFLKAKSYDEFSWVYYEDNGYSGSNKNRPGLSVLLSDVKSKKLDLVVCYSFSRISRSIRDLIDIVAELESSDVQFVSVSESVDTSSPMGRCFLHIIASLNQAEREILSERTKNGLRAAVARGKTLGRPKTRPAESILELSKQGLSQRKIARILGISKTTVQRELCGPKLRVG